ncbi:thioesterase II family protein [Streptomyces sp. GS7]|uniref:thioesterase II family protein n=1 Tax=Streptomyces sp. GS7 TaxID=2692234 RepID=UPI0013180EC3|nr:alpha/beta fold hydrolase [Streptomyces sp. GS7]QHC22327.1 alpha/beta fold hydrolase [Streptomyces sp. GS7]
MATTSENSNRWIRRFRPADDAPCGLVCFPHAGGSATFYFPVAQALSPQLDVLAVQYPGRQDRLSEPCLEDIHEVADQVTAALEPWTGRPLALFGHSMGATVAYEVARNLERSGRPPLGLFASGRRAPSRHRDLSVHLRDDDGLVATLKELSGTDEAVLADEELLRMVLPAVRADYKAVETYRHREGPRLSCPVSVLVGDSDPVTTPEEADAWREHTTGPCELTVLPGGHFYLNSQAEEVRKVIVRDIGSWA